MRGVNLIQEHKNKILNLAVLVLALIIAKNIYQSQNRAREILLEKRDAEKKKSVVLENIGQLEMKVSAYKKYLNKKEVDGLLNKIGALALESKVKIISARPGEKKAYPGYLKYFFDLKVSVDTYHNFAHFINRLENDPDIYIVEKAMLGQPSPGFSPEFQLANATALSADLLLSTLVLKDE